MNLELFANPVPPTANGFDSLRVVIYGLPYLYMYPCRILRKYWDTNSLTSTNNNNTFEVFSFLLLSYVAKASQEYESI